MKADDGIREDRRCEIDGEAERVESRRRLLKAGLIAVPLLVTLHALPARAGGHTHGSLGLYGYGDPGRRDKPRRGGRT